MDVVHVRTKWSLLLVGLLWQNCLCREVAAGSPANKLCNYQKTCMGLVYDSRVAVCCENRFHQGQGLSCCGEQAFNPSVATCCKDTSTANVTSGLSMEVSACCGVMAFNPLNEMCCQLTVVTRPSPKSNCCNKDAMDSEKHLCCGVPKRILLRTSPHHQCCGHNQFDPRNQCCCANDDVLQIQPKNSPCCVEDPVASSGRLKTTLPTLLGPRFLNSVEIHSRHVTVTKTGNCEGDFDKCIHLCCGALGNKKVLRKKSYRHKCCDHDQFDPETECCCVDNDLLVVKQLSSQCCKQNLDAQVLTPSSQRICTQPKTSRCGTLCFDPNKFSCCERENNPGLWCCESGGCDNSPRLYNTETHTCYDGCVSERKLWENEDTEDEGTYSEANVPYNPAKGTICCSQFHDTPGQHCCGTDTYQPEVEICCDGHRHPKVKSVQCCGVKTYNIQDPEVKCCEGTLHRMKLLAKGDRDAQCCGSLLQKPQDVCCSSEDKALMYANKTGFSCCGHLYYNLSLWSCCAGSLKPLSSYGLVQSNTATGSSLSSILNLPFKDLCNKIYLGTVESVSPHSIAFREVVEIYGFKGSVEALPSPYVLKTPDTCSVPRLTPGVMYYFNEENVFTVLYQKPLKSLHFIYSKCALSMNYD